MSASAANTSAPTTATRINWSPYLTGIGVGILGWIVFVVVNNRFGITTATSPMASAWVCRLAKA